MTSFVGRRVELSEVCRSIKSSRLVTITGAAGVGKTRLALRAASELGRRFPDGVWLVELSSVSTANVLAYIVAEVLGLRDQTVGRRADVLAQQIAGKHLLLVLDTCEHLVDACAALADRLLRAAPRLRIIATSRQPLDVSGEHVLTSEPLYVPGPVADTDLATLRRSDAVTLFAERAAAIVPGFALSRHNSAAVAQLCRRLDGVPLALELAAVRLRALSVDELLHQLDDGHWLLGAGRRGGVARHRTMRAAVGWSHELCTPAERLAWARLSVFTGDFGLAAATEMCAGPGIAAGTELRLLTALVDKSIVCVHRRGSEVRYRLLADIREYGREWLSRFGEELRARRLHRDWCLALACRSEQEWFTGHQADVVRRTEAEHASIHSALEFCFGTPGERWAGLDLAATLWFYWIGCGRLGEGRGWLDRGLTGAAAAEGPGSAPREALGRATCKEPDHANTTVGQTASWVKALWVDGCISILQGDVTSAVSMIEECMDRVTATADEVAIANSIRGLGAAALVGGDHAKAAELLLDALGRYEKLGEQESIVIMTSVELSMAGVLQGDLDAAVRIWAQIMCACEASGEQWACAYARYIMAFAAWEGRDAAGAMANARECLRIGHTCHDRVGMVLAIELIAMLSVGGGDPCRAAVLLGAASRIWPGVGLPLSGSTYLNGPYDERMRRASEALTEREFATAFECGAGLSLDRAVACALGDLAIPAPAWCAAGCDGSPVPDDEGAPERLDAGARQDGQDTREPIARAGSGQHGVDGPARTSGHTGAGTGGRAGGWGDRRADVPRAGPPEPALAVQARRPSPWPPLSYRECQVAALVADGLCNREIAQRLVIAKRTADSHVEHILAKLTFTSRTEVATWVTRRREGNGGEPPDLAPDEPSSAQRLLRHARYVMGSSPDSGERAQTHRM